MISSAFISWASLIVQGERDLIGLYGKLATIWFDKLILQVPRPESIRNVLDHCAETGTMQRDTAKELAKVWHPIQSELPGYEFLRKPWKHENATLVEIAKKVTIEATRREHPGAPEDYGFMREVAWAGAGLIDIVGTWAALHAQSGCYLLAEQREAAVVEEVFQPVSREQGFSCFSQVASNRIPDLRDLSWERIAELRNHPFLDQFRNKIAEMSSRIMSGDTKTAVGILDELQLRDLKEIATLVRPVMRWSVLKAFASNLPLPIPVNPISLGLAVNDVAEQFGRKHRYGWLYFLLDFEGDA